MKKHTQGFIKPLLIILVSVLLIAGAYFYFYKPANLSEKQFAGQVYNNDKLGFSITLPSNWSGYKVVENGNSLSIGFENNGKFSSAMSINSITEQEWSELESAEVHPTFIAKKDGKVFVYSHYNGDFENIDPNDFDKIVSSFKFSK